MVGLWGQSLREPQLGHVTLHDDVHKQETVFFKLGVFHRGTEDVLNQPKADKLNMTYKEVAGSENAAFCTGQAWQGGSFKPKEV